MHEAIYSLLMLSNNFICASANIEEIEPEAAKMDIVAKKREVQLTSVMSNSYGFGGTNACLIFTKITN